ncbi:MAG: type II toxin-antitoxin system RelE/ParE family toxin [Desulfobacteraceae bacterium]|nr:type II toxin-antitoxin system RelE/ParE family toxin [Desulfobacteraceae bacterium]
MIQYIKYHPRFKKQCEKLKKSNDQAIKAVDNALHVLLEFRRSRKNFKSMGTLTRSWEMRLKDCIKYSLGNGYRLVLAVKKDSLFVLCIGSHDQCDKWLERNRGVEEFNFVRQEKVLISRGKIENSWIGSDDIEPDMFGHIEDVTLRRIFSGICNSSG